MTEQKRQIDARTGRARGQAVVLFALLVPVTALFFLGVVDYMFSNARVMRTVAAADLAAHAGAQQIQVQPDGHLDPRAAEASAAATAFFSAQAPAQAMLLAVSCGSIADRPACQLEAQVASAGWLIPSRPITVRAVGYLVSGVTEGDQ